MNENERGRSSARKHKKHSSMRGKKGKAKLQREKKIYFPRHIFLLSGSSLWVLNGRYIVCVLFSCHAQATIFPLRKSIYEHICEIRHVLKIRIMRIKRVCDVMSGTIVMSLVVVGWLLPMLNFTLVCGQAFLGIVTCLSNYSGKMKALKVLKE